MATDGQKCVSILKNYRRWSTSSAAYADDVAVTATSSLKMDFRPAIWKLTEKKKAFPFKPFLLVVLKLRCLSVLSLTNVRQAGVVWHYGIH